MKLLEYLDNKIKKYQTGGAALYGKRVLEVDNTNMRDSVKIGDAMDIDLSAADLSTADLSAADLVNNVKNFYLQHPTYDELNLFQKIFDVINRDPLGFFKLFRIKLKKTLKIKDFNNHHPLELRCLIRTFGLRLQSTVMQQIVDGFKTNAWVL